MLIKQISVFVENKQGRLADITKLLADNDIDIRALSIADTADYGILRLIVNKPEEAIKALKAAGMTVSITNVLAVAIPDVPGGFAHTISVLSDANMGVEYAYAFITPSDGQAYVILRVDDNERAIEVLKAGGISLLSQGALS